MLAETRTGPDAARPDVLLVEDNPDGRESLRLLLTLLGFTVESAGDGEEGLRMGLELRPPAAVLDIGLPGMNGYEVARRLRDEMNGDVLLIAHTGYSGPEGRERAKAAGFDALLAKPADVYELARLLRTAA
jgi:CheY-like chemotaxis protein